MALNNNNIDQAHTYIIQDFVENISYRKSAAVHTHTHTNKTIGVWGTYRHFIERAISGKCLLVKRQFQYNVSPSTYKCIDLIIYGWKRPYKFFINTEFGCSLNLFSFWRGFSSIFFFSFVRNYFQRFDSYVMKVLFEKQSCIRVSENGGRGRWERTWKDIHICDNRKCKI